ncbi:MAG: thioredoxin domain-containing protein [Acidobacteria bacterium]|nr:thioredoxin domain-containing protein [Acidobacteriota bacterium]
MLGTMLPRNTASALTTSEASVDKLQLMNYIRYAEGLASTTSIEVADPAPTVHPDLLQVSVKFVAKGISTDRIYYLSRDGTRLISGEVYDLGRSPFVESLLLLRNSGDPAAGEDAALIEVYLFSDFQCPYCKEQAAILRKIVSRQGSHIKLIHKNFPFSDIHSWAMKSAEYGVCIAKQDLEVFWSYYYWMFDRQESQNEDRLDSDVLEFTKIHHLDKPALDQCLANGSAVKEVSRTIAEGEKLGVDQTPTLFINGRKITGAITTEQFNALVELELSRLGILEKTSHPRGRK